jgi:hypothetical protein
VDARGDPRRWLAGAVLAGLLALGAAARARGLDRSLWLDEAWVANSVLEPSIAAMLRYEAWLQTSPPLFLVLVRGAVDLAGESNAAFRAVPALFSLAAIGLFAWLALRWLRPPAALAALALFAFSPRLVAQGASLKPYASDAFAALALLARGDAYLARPSARRLAAALASGALLSLLSFAAPLFLPALALACLPRRGPSPAAPAWHALAIAATAALAAAGLLAGFVLPNREPSLLEYFRRGFFPGGGPLVLAGWIAERCRLAVGFAPGLARGGALEALVALLAAVGVLDLALRGRAGDARSGARAALLAAPLAGALALNLAGALPMARGNDRILLFLFPGAALSLGAGIEALARLTARLRAARPAPAALARDAAAWLALALAGALLLAAARRGELRALAVRLPEEEAEAAVAFVARTAGADDVVYVHSTMRESLRLYARRTPLASSRIVLGEIDWPCCPRGRPYARSEDPARELPGELARIAAAGPRGRELFVLVTDRASHFRQRGRRSPALLERGLASLGCARAATTSFRGVRVDRYACAPASGL